jgi:hypothetical protein
MPGAIRQFRSLEPLALLAEGLYLIRQGQADRISGSKSLELHLPADFHAIDAWRKLHAGAKADSILNSVLLAVRHGPPVATESLRLTRDALDLVGAESSKAMVDPVRTARRHLAAIAKHTDWSSALLRFSGSTPSDPGVVPLNSFEVGRREYARRPEMMGEP